MPLYEYKCHQCGKHFDVLQKFSDEPLKTHEECGGALERLVSASAFNFKGTGWYVTDYAKSNSSIPSHGEGKGGEKSEGKSDSKSDSKSDGKSESKSESKPESKTESPKPAPASSTTR